MKANFNFIYPSHHRDPEHDADDHAKWLAEIPHLNHDKLGGFNQGIGIPKEFNNYYCVDVLGKEFVWMNESFPKDRYKWYLWYESVFLVPEEMAIILRLRWS